MTQKEALKWIKLNWNHLVKTGRLDTALKRYFQKYHLNEKDSGVPEAHEMFDGGLGI